MSNERDSVVYLCILDVVCRQKDGHAVLPVDSSQVGPIYRGVDSILKTRPFHWFAHIGVVSPSLEAVDCREALNDASNRTYHYRMVRPRVEWQRVRTQAPQ